MANTTQVRATGKHIIAEGRMRPGTTFWCSAERARQLVDAKVVEIAGASLPGPSETKPAGAAEKKTVSSGDPAGPLTGSAASSTPGEDAASCTSPAGPALTVLRSWPFSKRGKQTRD